MKKDDRWMEKGRPKKEQIDLMTEIFVTVIDPIGVAENRATIAWNNQKYDEAADYYSAALKANIENEGPNNNSEKRHQLLSERSEAYSLAGKAEFALDDAEECVRMKPSNTKGRMALANAKLAAGRHEEAFILFYKLSKEDDSKEAAMIGFYRCGQILGKDRCQALVAEVEEKKTNGAAYMKRLGKYFPMAMTTRGKIFDTKCNSSPCLHGACDVGSARRKKKAFALGCYIAEEMMDDADGAPRGFTLIQYCGGYNQDEIDDEMVKLLRADATNAILNNSDDGIAKKWARLALKWKIQIDYGDEWKALSRQMKNRQFSNELLSFSKEMARATQLADQMETPFEVAKYLDKNIPCKCLSNVVKELKKNKGKEERECYWCHKKFPESQILVCSKCDSAEYCSSKCQVSLYM